MTTAEEFRPRVREGIAAIEAHEPGAIDRINLDTLDPYSLTHCALAQAVGKGAYHNGCRRLGIAPFDAITAPYGFAVTPDEESNDHGGNYAALREAWVTELTLHRTAKAAIVAD